MKTVGIIGGMGPLATADLFNTIVRMTDARCDSGHIPILIDNNTRIPDRTAALLHGGADPRPEIINSAKRLEAMGADFLIMPCNTAHSFYNDIAGAISIPFLNMVEEAAGEAARRKLKRVGLLSTEGTLKTGIYDSAFETRGIQLIKADEQEQQRITALIYDGVKKGDSSIDISGFCALLDRMESDGAEAFVLACSELPIAFKAFGLCQKTLNPTEVLAASTIKFAGGRVRRDYTA